MIQHRISLLDNDGLAVGRMDMLMKFQLIYQMLLQGIHVLQGLDCVANTAGHQRIFNILLYKVSPNPSCTALA